MDAFLVTTSSTASIAPPTARSAASKLPGDIEVSASSWTSPSFGEALLIVTLKGMREAGYAYGVIGDPGPVAFYQKRLDAMEIPKSKPGIYAGMLRSKPATSD